MKPIPTTNSENWTAQIWPGNPALNLVCSCKIFVNPFNGRKTPVWLFGGTKEYPGFNFTVSAGANSDFSYTGRVDSHELHKAEIEVDDLYSTKKLFR